MGILIWLRRERRASDFLLLICVRCILGRRFKRFLFLGIPFTRRSHVRTEGLAGFDLLNEPELGLLSVFRGDFEKRRLIVIKAEFFCLGFGRLRDAVNL